MSSARRILATIARPTISSAMRSITRSSSAKRPGRRPCGHVTGQQLLEGIRLYALKQFGPMVPTVFEYWGIRRCDDFGEMVFNLIRVGIFGKTESDSIDDFRGAYTFHDAFVAPFLPERPVAHPRFRMDAPAGNCGNPVIERRFLSRKYSRCAGFDLAR